MESFRSRIESILTCLHGGLEFPSKPCWRCKYSANKILEEIEGIVPKERKIQCVSSSKTMDGKTGEITAFEEKITYDKEASAFNSCREKFLKSLRGEK